MMDSWGPGRTGTPPPPHTIQQGAVVSTNSTGLPATATVTCTTGSAAAVPHVVYRAGGTGTGTAPIASPEGVSDVSRLKKQKRKKEIANDRIVEWYHRCRRSPGCGTTPETRRRGPPMDHREACPTLRVLMRYRGGW